jgi:ribosomal-protein-alanine N-acetyltransferase
MEFTTDRLVLREFTLEDWPAVLAYQSDPLYLRYTQWTERTPEAVQAFVQMFIAQQEQQPRSKYQLVVTLRSTGQLIGNCGIRLEPPGVLSGEVHEAEIGYELAPAHWAQGYATEAAGAIVRYGFEELRVHRIGAWCIAENIASAHVLEKLGMRAEGRLREKEYFRGRWWDTLLYAILDHEWHAQRNRAE